ncbi:MAG: ribose-phosphate diphosphokinase, partial [Candidatus Micrarchaeaceae archaeon]
MASAFSIVCDGASYDLAKAVAKDLGVGDEGIVTMDRTEFKDGEFKLRFSKDVKSDEAVLILRMYPHVNDNIVEMILALKKLNDMGKSIKVVLPYLAYARQDKEFLPGEVASIYALGDMMAHYNVNELIVLDVHSADIGARMGIKVRNISAIGMLAEHLKNSSLQGKPLVISPDKGSAERSRVFADAINAEFTYLEKHRDRVTGEVTTEDKELGLGGRAAVIFDDMI